MQLCQDDPFPEPAAAWDSFAADMRLRFEQWNGLRKEFGHFSEGLNEDLLHGVALPYLRLIPLVEAMRSYPVIYSLYPFTSHQWLRLSTLPVHQSGGEFSAIWAAATGENCFQVRRMLVDRLPDWQFEDLAEGPAAEMARLIADEVARERRILR